MDQDPMKLFGQDRSATADVAPAPIGDAAPERKSLWRAKGFKRLLSALVLLAVVAVCVVGYTRANNYGTRIVQARPVDARIEIVNPPAWLDRRIVGALLDEAYQLAQKDQATYDRSRNTQDAGILREFADLYTGTAKASPAPPATAATDPAPVNRQTVGYNAWIKQITEVRRNVAKDKSIQTIEITAEWREPAAWVRVKDLLCLIDADGTRLPGDYHADDRPRSRLMAMTGIDLPATQVVPQPGERWTAAGGQLGGDLLAGMNLVNALRHQQFAGQISEIDLSNYEGRQNPLAAWIVLDTVFNVPGGSGVPAASQVQWGRAHWRGAAL